MYSQQVLLLTKLVCVCVCVWAHRHCRAISAAAAVKEIGSHDRLNGPLDTTVHVHLLAVVKMLIRQPYSQEVSPPDSTVTRPRDARKAVACM